MKRVFVDSSGLGSLGMSEVVILVASVLIAAAILILGYGRYRGTHRWRRPQKSRNRVVPWSGRQVERSATASNMADPQAQIEAISKVSFEKQRIMNRGEFEIFQVLERIVREIGAGHRVMAQTSLGELIQPRRNRSSEALRRNAYASINSKRLDFALIDRFGLLAAAVEFQGSGHYHHKTFMRDAVKREALRRADVELIEVHANWDADEVCASVRRVLKGLAPPSPKPVPSSADDRAGIQDARAGPPAEP